MKHELKTIQPWFDEVWDGEKTFEIRVNDRGYKTLDTLLLREYDPETMTYGSRYIRAIVGTIIQGQFGLPKDICVMSLLCIRRIP
jgi:hypothetical protein